MSLTELLSITLTTQQTSITPTCERLRVERNFLYTMQDFLFVEVSDDVGVADEDTSMKRTFHPAWAYRLVSCWPSVK